MITIARKIVLFIVLLTDFDSAGKLQLRRSEIVYIEVRSQL